MGHALVVIASLKATIETKLIPSLSRKVSHSLGMLRPVQSVRFAPPSERTKSRIMPEACRMSLLMLPPFPVSKAKNPADRGKVLSCAMDVANKTVVEY